MDVSVRLFICWSNNIALAKGRFHLLCTAKANQEIMRVQRKKVSSEMKNCNDEVVRIEALAQL